MKALILAAGRGSRLAGHHNEVSKCMLRLFGKPLVQYSLENAARAGVDEIVLVVGVGAEAIINHFSIDFQGVRIRYVIQDEPQGLVHAMDCARDFLGDSDFMLLLSDEILWAPRHEQMIRRFRDHELFVICGVVETEDREQIRKTYAVIEDDRDRRIYRLIEKPRRPPSQVRGTGNCIFRAEILDYVALNARFLPWGGAGYRDVTSGYRMYSRRAVELLTVAPMRSRAFDFHIEALAYVHRAGMRVEETPIHYAFTNSSLRLSVVWEALGTCTSIWVSNLR